MADTWPQWLTTKTLHRLRAALLRNTPCQGRSIRTVTAILDAAERLIAEAGQVTFTAAELATAAGMSIGRVYYWYSDLGSVMVAVRQRIARAFEDAHVLAAGGFDLEHVVDQVLVEHPAAVVLCFVGLQAERDVVRAGVIECFGYEPIEVLCGVLNRGGIRG